MALRICPSLALFPEISSSPLNSQCLHLVNAFSVCEEIMVALMEALIPEKNILPILKLEYSSYVALKL